MSDVPPGIITEILVRLPVKSLLRFRCVSKSWRSLIDGDYFIKLHLHHSAETNSNRTLIIESNIMLLHLDLDSFERLDTGDLRFNTGYVSGICNGLVLIVTTLNDVVFIWNPSTRKLNEVPPVKLNSEFYKLCVVCSERQRYALGYDSKHDDYKVVSVARTSNAEAFPETNIYSLKTNSWKKVGDFPSIRSGGRTWGIYVNDAVHAIVELESDHSSVEVIMALDLANEGYYEVPRPGCAGVGHRLASVGVIGGCFAAVIFSGEANNEIWVMKEYRVKSSWYKLFCFNPSSPKPRHVDLFPLAISKSGDEVLLNYEGALLAWCNLGAGSMLQWLALKVLAIFPH